MKLIFLKPLTVCTLTVAFTFYALSSNSYEEANEISEMSVYLDAGTYYVKTNVPSIGEDCIQIRIWE